MSLLYIRPRKSAFGENNVDRYKDAIIMMISRVSVCSQYEFVRSLRLRIAIVN